MKKVLRRTGSLDSILPDPSPSNLPFPSHLNREFSFFLSFLYGKTGKKRTEGGGENEEKRVPRFLLNTAHTQSISIRTRRCRFLIRTKEGILSRSRSTYGQWLQYHPYEIVPSHHEF